MSGLTSALAPISSKTVGLPVVPGRAVAMQGRLTPAILPTPKLAAAKTAPVEPAEKNPSASPSRTAAQPRTILESFLVRMASVGCSPISMTSVVTSALARSRPAQKGVTTSSFPATMTESPFSVASAASIPARTTSGFSSPPMASTHMQLIVPPRSGHATRQNKRRPTLTGRPPRSPKRSARLGYSVTTTSRSL